MYNAVVHYLTFIPYPAVLWEARESLTRDSNNPFLVMYNAVIEVYVVQWTIIFLSTYLLNLIFINLLLIILLK